MENKNKRRKFIIDINSIKKEYERSIKEKIEYYYSVKDYKINENKQTKFEINNIDKNNNSDISIKKRPVIDIDSIRDEHEKTIQEKMKKFIQYVGHHFISLRK